MKNMNRELRLFNTTSNENILANKNFKFALDHLMLIFKSKSIYTFIPKNGCSNLRYSIAVSNGFIEQNNFSVTNHTWIDFNNKTFVPRLDQIFDSKFLFVVLRNPYKRIVSCYLDQIVPLSSFLEEKYEKIFLGRIKKKIYKINRKKDLKRIKFDNISFKQFIKNIYDKDLLLEDEHWTPQNNFFIVKNYDEYIDLDDFDNKIKYLENKTGIKIFDTRNLYGTQIIKNKTNNNYHGETDAFTIKKMKINKLIPPYKYFYDEETLKLTKELYNEDISFYDKIFNTSSLEKLNA